ncbi:UDP-glucuronosyltransferase 2A1-like isoform X2 [Ptychodera flava]
MNPVWNAGMYNVPNNPAYIPCLGTGLTDKMTFWDRVYNTAFFIAQYIEFNMALVKFGAIQQKNNIRPDLGIRDLYGDAELFLFNIDFTSSSPRPLMPNTIYLGGYFTEPGRPLDKDLEDFINSSGKHGVVIFALGTYQVLTNTQFKRFAAALGRLPQKVIAKYGGGDTPDYLKNTTKFKLLKWIPQNDLLGHPKTKALVYHGGVNGIQEAIYHAIPVVGMPIFWDQYDNVQLLVERGMAVALDVNTMTSEDLYQATTKVIEDPKYKENALRLSRINRDRPMQPKELFIFWIEYIIRHGGTHLRSQAANLNAFQYYLIDVIAFLAIISVIAGLAILKTCRFFRRAFHAKKKEKKH